MGPALNMLHVVLLVVMLSRLGNGFQLSEGWMNVGQSNIVETYALPEQETKKLFKIYNLREKENSIFKPLQNSLKKQIEAQDVSEDVPGNNYKHASDKKDIANAYRIIRLTSIDTFNSSETSNSSETLKRISDDEQNNDLDKMNVHASQYNKLHKKQADEPYKLKHIGPYKLRTVGPYKKNTIIGPRNAPHKINASVSQDKKPDKIIENGPHASESYNNGGVVERYRIAHSPFHSK
jgi:hypothetical protein